MSILTYFCAPRSSSQDMVQAAPNTNPISGKKKESSRSGTLTSIITPLAIVCVRLQPTASRSSLIDCCLGQKKSKNPNQPRPPNKLHTARCVYKTEATKINTLSLTRTYIQTSHQLPSPSVVGVGVSIVYAARAHTPRRTVDRKH